jgi:Outer membrane protein beta-barrel family/Carboxypeptidase regulatory-like domain
MLRVILAGLFSISYLISFSQPLTIRGKVVDSASVKGLPYATISVISAKDSMLIAFTIADTAGHFQLTRIAPGKYMLSVSYTGYSPRWLSLEHLSAETVATETPETVPERPIDAVTQRVIEVGTILLTDASSLRAAQVTAKRPPVEVNNDTLEFNAENFKTQPNAVVEDMLKKMPGVTVGDDGAIKINGQTVRRVLVNGKEFFTGDIKMATKNLNADAVDKIQVYDRASDQAAFTGVDDGNSEKTINIKLKKDRNFATFGKMSAGAGIGGTPNAGSPFASASRFDAQANINKFSGDEQLSLLAMGNNTNRQGFTLQDVLNFTGELSRGARNGGGGIQLQSGSNAGDNNGLPVTGLGQNQQGIATTFAGGLNYNNTWEKGRTSLNANYTASHIRLLTNQQSLTQNATPGNDYNTTDTSGTIQNITQNRVGAILDQQFDSSFSLRLTPSLTWQRSNKQLLDNYTSYSLPDSLLLNNGNNNNSTTPGAFYFTTDILLRKRLAKKGRTLSADVNISYNHSTQGATQLSNNMFYQPGSGSTGSASGSASGSGSSIDSNINELNNRNALTRSIGGNITYTEPLGKTSLLALTSFYNVNTGSSDRLAYNYDSTIRKYSLPDTLLIDNFASNYRYAGGGASYRRNWRKVNLTAGITLQAAMLDAMNKSAGSSINQSFTDLLPNALLQYNFSRTKNLRLIYNTYTTQPSVTQLQPVPDLSNPLDITTGNPGLRRSYNQSLTLNYFSAHPATRTDLLFLLNITKVSNAIVQDDSVTLVGARFTTPVNANGVGNILSDVVYGFPLMKLHSRLEVGGQFKYSKNVDFINGATDNSNSMTLRPEFTYSYGGSDKFDLRLTAAVAFISGRYSLQPSLNTNYQRQNYGVNMTQYLPFNFSFHNEFNYIINSGRSNGYNSSIPLWNSWLAKSFLHNGQAELKLAVMDLLDRNAGIARDINQGSVVDQRYNVLQRYFLLSFTYSLNKSGLHPKGGPEIKLRTVGD